MANRLAQETSPYLRQHANNPVDWYAWSEEALSRARTENKPILLSVGYSACHWCHVMEHESFENPAIAELMNQNFINIKVDREERPDLDQIYQNVAQLITRGGGWPLTVFLTPDLRPFFGGTYFPPEDRYGRPGFGRVLQALSEAYKNDPNSIAENARRLTEAIQKMENLVTESHKRPDRSALRTLADRTLSAIDWRHGGFGDAPKFPHTMGLSFLWRFGKATGFGMAKEAVTLTLSKMAQKGIYDQLGGGFHRYSVDESWSVPHFEKMLYDNACLLKLYSEVLVNSTSEELSNEDRELYLRVVRETSAYVLREMASESGGFYSTQDADSEGVEGKFFVWDPKSIREILSEEEAASFLLRYGVTEAGNFEHQGQTVLFLDRTSSEIASTLGKSKEEIAALIENAKQKLFHAREKRVHPGLDDKVIASWNGLMISGLCWAQAALRDCDPSLAKKSFEAAQAAFKFIQAKMSRPEHRLWSVYKDGQAKLNAYLDDYAFLAKSALDLARFSSSPDEIEAYLNQAKAWTDVARRHFTDREHGGFYFTSDDHEKLIQRPKNIYDQSMPSGNAVLLECMIALDEITGQAEYGSEGDEHLYKLFPFAEQAPLGTGELACTALLQATGPITVSGRAAEEACTHPHVFQKADRSANGQLVCHRKTCEAPYSTTELSRKSIQAKLVL
ncbi:MAG: thioredoxin domain-containing protein [Bdellovibrionota bacterium]